MHASGNIRNQPLHAFDLARLNGPVVVRRAGGDLRLNSEKKFTGLPRAGLNLHTIVQAACLRLYLIPVAAPE